MADQMQRFENQPVRTLWDEERQEWCFSVVDVCGVLSESANPRRYWSDLKRKLKAEGSELYDEIVQLKMKSTDGKVRATDAATLEQVLRLVQSIPSRRAEPFKLWLAQVGRERIEETIDPEQAMDRAVDTYAKKGYPSDWIQQRLLSIRVRNELTEAWKNRGIQKGVEYAILTDEITRAWFRRYHAPVQEPEGTEKGKPKGQHDHHGAGAQHAGRDLHHRHLPS